MSKVFVFPLTVRYSIVARQTQTIVEAIKAKQFQGGKLLFMTRSETLRSHFRLFEEKPAKKAASLSKQFVTTQADFIILSHLFHVGASILRAKDELVFDYNKKEFFPDNKTQWKAEMQKIGTIASQFESDFGELFAASERLGDKKLSRSAKKAYMSDVVAEACAISMIPHHIVDKGVEEKEATKATVSVVYPQFQYEENEFLRVFTKILEKSNFNENFEIKLI